MASSVITRRFRRISRERLFNELPHDRDIVLLCHHGMRSLQVANFLHSKGLSRLYNLSGGIAAWAADVDPAMAKRTQTLARRVVEDFDGDAARIWTTAADANEVSKRIAKLPGFSANKARVIIGTLAKRLAVEVPGWEAYSPDWFSMADVDSKAALVKYREIKRAAKAAGSWPPGTKAKAKPAARKASSKKTAARKAAPRG